MLAEVCSTYKTRLKSFKVECNIKRDISLIENYIWAYFVFIMPNF